MNTLPSSEKLARFIFEAEQKHGGKAGNFNKITDKERVDRLSIASDILAELYKYGKK